MLVPHVADQLQALADGVEVEPLGHFEGWTVDRWHVQGESLANLLEVYQAMLMGGLETEIAQSLAENGIDVDGIFHGEDPVDRITRSDLTELAAAAAAASVDGWPLETMHLPNVPKGSRKRSEAGIDILAVSMDLAAETDSPLGEGEILYIGSVKHSIVDPGDCRYKLQSSVSDGELTLPYLTQQLRVFHGKLTMAGVDASRLYLFLRGFPDESQIEVAIVGAVDAEKSEDLLAQMTNLTALETGRVCRHLLFEDIADLHTLVGDD